MSLTQNDLMAGFHVLGLREGMGVVLHSPLRSLGHVEGGAATVVAALMAVLTERGTLLMPSFNHGKPWEAGGQNVYDPQHTGTINGTIPDTFWRMPGVQRSLDPTHPMAAWGRNAKVYVAEHHKTLSMGPHSPLGRLHANGGYGLLLGVDYTTNTFHHVVETTLNAPCIGKRSEAYTVQLPDGRRVLGRTWGWRARNCPFTDSALYGNTMQTRGLHTQQPIGAAIATFFKLSDCFDVVAEYLQHGNADAPPCHRCPIRPRHNAHTVASDWDEQHATLLPDSVALTY